MGELATDEQFGRILDLINLSYGYDETRFEIEDYIEKLNVRHRSRIQKIDKKTAEASMKRIAPHKHDPVTCK